MLAIGVDFTGFARILRPFRPHEVTQGLFVMRRSRLIPSLVSASATERGRKEKESETHVRSD